ncbi:hypothetical protein MCAMS1_02537 [biofilm metagenome]
MDNGVSLVVLECNYQDIYTVIYVLTSHSKFQFEDWAALNNALLDYIEVCVVDLSGCLIARYAQNTGASILYIFWNEKYLGALSVVDTLKKG